MAQLEQTLLGLVSTSPPEDQFLGQVVAFYDKIAEYYDVIYGDHVRSSESILEIARIILKEKGIKPEAVLDIGCGTGWDIIDLYHEGWQCEYYGFDLSQAMIARSAANLAAHGIRAELWEGNMLDPNFGYTNRSMQDTFDVAIFRGNSLGHLHYEDYARAFSNVYASLRPGGLFLFDFRDGYEQFGSRLPVEIRDSGLNPVSNTRYLSAYLQEHPAAIRDPYHFMAVLMTWKGGDTACNTVEFPIRAHYVLIEDVVSALHSAGYASWEEITERAGRSLPFLRSFIAMKG